MRLAAPSWCLQPGRITVMRSLVGWLIRSGGKICRLAFKIKFTFPVQGDELWWFLCAEVIPRHDAWVDGQGGHEGSGGQ